MSKTLLPQMLRDDTGYNTEGNRKLETGWREVSRGLNLVLLGNLLVVATIVFLIWLTLGLIDSSTKIVRSQTRVNWQLLVSLVGGAIVFFAIIYAYWLMLKGQWLCLWYAPERRFAKTLMFCCMLCIISVPLLNFTSGWIGGMEAATAMRKGIPEDPRLTDYLQLASHFLFLAGQVLFILFLRAVASCFEKPVLVMASNLYLAFTLLLLGCGIYFVFFSATMHHDSEALIDGFKRGNTGLLLEAGLLLFIAVGSLVSFIWYLWLVLSVRRCIDRGVKELFRSPLDQPAWT